MYSFQYVFHHILCLRHGEVILKKKKKRPSSKTFLSLGPVTILGPDNPCNGACPVPWGCSAATLASTHWMSAHAKLITNHGVSRCCQTSPGGPQDLQLKSTGLVDTLRFTPSWKISKQVSKVRKERKHLLEQRSLVQMVTSGPAAEGMVFLGPDDTHFWISDSGV